MIEDLDPAAMPIESKVLRMLKAGVMHAASMELVRNADLDVFVRDAARTLTMKLEARILADDVLVDEKDLYFESYVTVLEDKLVRRWRWLPGIYRKVEVAREVPVHGSVKVRAEYFATFPQIDRAAYPSDFGRPVRLMQFNAAANWADQG